MIGPEGATLHLSSNNKLTWEEKPVAGARTDVFRVCDKDLVGVGANTNLFACGPPNKLDWNPAKEPPEMWAVAQTNSKCIAVKMIVVPCTGPAGGRERPGGTSGIVSVRDGLSKGVWFEKVV